MPSIQDKLKNDKVQLHETPAHPSFIHHSISHLHVVRTGQKPDIICMVQLIPNNFMYITKLLSCILLANTYIYGWDRKKLSFGTLLMNTILLAHIFRKYGTIEINMLLTVAKLTEIMSKWVLLLSVYGLDMSTYRTLTHFVTYSFLLFRRYEKPYIICIVHYTSKQRQVFNKTTKLHTTGKYLCLWMGYKKALNSAHYLCKISNWLTCLSN